MYYRSTLQHRTMWLNMKYWSTTSNWPRRSAFGGFYVMEIPIWWCNNALEIGMQKMKTWQVTDSWCSSYLVSSKGVNSITSPELKMSSRCTVQIGIHQKGDTSRSFFGKHSQAIYQAF